MIEHLKQQMYDIGEELAYKTRILAFKHAAQLVCHRCRRVASEPVGNLKAAKKTELGYLHPCENNVDGVTCDAREIWEHIELEFGPGEIG